MTNVGVLGTGQVGLTLASRLAQVGHTVVVGARSRDSSSLGAFADVPNVGTGSFTDAADAADLVINATNGLHSQAALAMAGQESLAGKAILDVSNALEPVAGGFPRPVATVDDSVGQRLQAAFPRSRVVKSLCTMNCTVMADPSLVPGDHVVFLSGDDAAAKSEVRDLLATLGWRAVQMVDLGGIDTAAAQELLMPLWMRITVGRGGDAPRFNWAINAVDRS